MKKLFIFLLISIPLASFSQPVINFIESNLSPLYPSDGDTLSSCRDTLIMFKANVTGGTTPYEFFWDFDDGIKENDIDLDSVTHIYDEDGFMIGTFNFDSRSAYYNTELALFCDGNEILTNIVKDSLLYRKDHLSDPPRGIKINEADDIHADAGFFKWLIMKIMRFVNLENLF